MFVLLDKQSSSRNGGTILAPSHGSPVNRPSAKQMLVLGFPLTGWAFGSWFVCLGGRQKPGSLWVEEEGQLLHSFNMKSQWESLNRKAGRAWRSPCLHSLFYRWGNGGPEWGGTLPESQSEMTYRLSQIVAHEKGYFPKWQQQVCKGSSMGWRDPRSGSKSHICHLVGGHLGNLSLQFPLG